jgi:hypothetical protein
VQIFASSGLSEEKIAALLAAVVPIDAFGVGTEMSVSADAPALDIACKLTHYADLGRAKLSTGKRILPEPKQVFRRAVNGVAAGDVIAFASEEGFEGEPLLQPIMRAGRRLVPRQPLATIQREAAARLAALPVRLRSSRPPIRPTPSRSVPRWLLARRRSGRGLGRPIKPGHQPAGAEVNRFCLAGAAEAVRRCAEWLHAELRRTGKRVRFRGRAPHQVPERGSETARNGRTDRHLIKVNALRLKALPAMSYQILLESSCWSSSLRAQRSNPSVGLSRHLRRSARDIKSGGSGSNAANATTRCPNVEREATMPDVKQIARVVVWNPVVRYGHWALVAAFVVACLSAEDEAGGLRRSWQSASGRYGRSGDRDGLCRRG